ncbi:MAG: NACHT domain-containing protein [Crocosphaera sp.]|nr:NACHT domain-containing protein [Crocosphaera sp.]
MKQNDSVSGDNIGRDKNEQTSNDFSDANVGGGFAGRDYHENITNKNTQNFYYNKPQSKRDENQRNLIQYSKNTATRLLSQSLRNQVYITLDKQVDETKVIPAMQLKRGEQKVEFLPSGTSIINVYDRAKDIQGRLLILGDPGAGKSTALYQLAEILAIRAENDINHPIPLLFNLSSWTNNYTTIKDWLIDELNVQHGFNKKLAQEYLEEQLIIPLLDGLDELRSDRQAVCVDAINKFLLPRHWKNPLVVCSRLKEFELLNTRIGLNGSVILQPLSDEQINEYLQETKALTIQQLIQGDEEWRDLAKIPLFLDIMVLANDKLSRESQKGLTTQREKIFYLMEVYLEERLDNVGYWQSKYEQKIRNSPQRRQQSLKSYLQYVRKPQQTRHYLQWLARQLDRNNQTIFLIEKLQPTDLANNRQRRIFGLIVGLIYGLIVGLIYGLIYGLIVGLIVGLIYGLKQGELEIKTQPNQGIRYSVYNAIVTTALVIILGGGVIFGVMDDVGMVKSN